MYEPEGSLIVLKGCVWAMICLLPLQVSAGVYQWKDAQGRVHFGDRPPEDVGAKPMQIKPPTHLNSDNEAAGERQREIDSFFKRRQKERLADEKAQEKADQREKAREENCRKMLSQLRHNERVSVFYELNEQGERVFLDEATGNRHREAFRQRYQKECGDI
ncbi:DUF4124 domain-containing protein [Marinobacter sp. 1Y8]